MRAFVRLAIDDCYRSADARGSYQRAVRRYRNRDHRSRASCDLTRSRAGSRQKIKLTISAAGRYFTIAADCHSVERARHCNNGRRPAGERPDAHALIVAHGDQRATVRSECNAIDVLSVPFEHTRRTARERPQPNRMIPRRRSQCCAVGRRRERGDRCRMAFQNGIGLHFAGSPDCNAPVGARGRGVPVPQQHDRIDGAGMEPQHLLGRIARQRPADRG